MSYVTKWRNVLEQITKYSYSRVFEPGNLLKTQEQARVNEQWVRNGDGAFNRRTHI